MAAAQQQRAWYLEDRANEREYNRNEENEARAYDRAQLDETRAYSRQVLGNLVEDAESAGFNPLTVMRSGGASSYNSAAGLAPLSASRLTSSPAQMQQAPVRQAVGGSAVGSAMGAVGDFLSNFDPFADQKKEQEYRLVESQIAALNASALSGVAKGQGSYASNDFERRPSRAAAALSKPFGVVASSGVNAPGEGHLVGGDNPTVSSLGLNNGKYGWFHSPWVPDGEAYETVYGDSEVGSTAFWVAKKTADTFYSAHRNSNAAWGDLKSWWRKSYKKAAKTAKSQTPHQADSGSWMDFAPPVLRR